MLRVVIADDERRICELIRNIVPWDEIDSEVVGMAGNGPSALEMVRVERPDVLITDMRMPGFDGIELIRRLHEEGIRPHVIIISGYRHFEYAHNALQYGVEHYLLKPINQHALIAALKSIRGREEQKTVECNERASIRHEMAIGKTKLNQQLIRACLTDSFAADENTDLTRLNSAFGTNFVPQAFRFMIIKLDITTKSDVHIDRILEKIRTIAESALKAVCLEYVSGQYINGIAAILNYAEGDYTRIRHETDMIAQQAQELVDMFDCFQLTVAIGRVVTEPSSFVHGMRTADVALKSRIFPHTEGIIEYDSLPKENIPVPQVFGLEKQSILRSLLETGQDKKLRSLFMQVMAEVQNLPKRSPSLLFDLAAELRAIVVDVADKAEVDEESLDALLHGYDNQIENATSVQSLRDAALFFLENAATLVAEKKRFDNTKPVRIAKEYMDQHYMDDDIGLEVLAQKAHIGSAYLSSIFRKETGVNVVEYLTHVRMEAAKQLLRKTNDSLVIISEEVGYSDPKYFSKLFRREVGLKPSEYRKLHK